MLENLWVQVVQILKVFSKYFGNVVKQFCQFYLKGGKEKLKELLLYVVKLEPWVLSLQICNKQLSYGGNSDFQAKAGVKERK